MESARHERDHYADFLRGIATLNIIFIHTIAWSGKKYVPANIYSLSLILDVPFFFFISGMVSSREIKITKTISQMFAIYKKYVFFSFFYFIILIVLGFGTGNWKGVTAPNLYQHFFFMNSKGTLLPGVYYSSWFLPTYFTVIPIGSLLLSLIQNEINREDEYYDAVKKLFAVVFLGLSYTWLTGKTFVLMPRETLFYLCFFLLGVLCKKVKIERFGTLAILLFFDLGFMKFFGWYFGWDISASMQAMKFPPNIVYFLYSLIMILVALWGKRLSIGEGNLFSRIGRNSSLWFYFCQGISGSALYYIVPHVMLPWYMKLPLMFVCNLLICILLVSIIQWMWNGFENIMKKSHNRLTSEVS